MNTYQQQPATPGQEGFTVIGDVLPAKPGQVHALIAGEGTEISKNTNSNLGETAKIGDEILSLGRDKDELCLHNKVTNVNNL